jgi:hypothetical protein
VTPTLTDYVARAVADYGVEIDGQRWASSEHVLREIEAQRRADNPTVQHARGSHQAVAWKLSRMATRGELARRSAQGMWWYAQR